MSALLVALATFAAALGADGVEAQPARLEPIELEWYAADGVPRRWGEVEGWVLAYPVSRPYAVRRARLRTVSALLTTFGGSVFVVGAGVAARDFDDADGVGAAMWAPLIAGAAMVAVAVPMMRVAKDQERKAAAAYSARPDTDTVSLLDD